MPEQSQVETFVSKRADYYSQKWQISENRSAPEISFNVAAFLAGIFWLVYRKLYIPLLTVIGVMVVDILLSTYLEESGPAFHKAISAWDRLSPFVYATVIGVFGNSWYWRKFAGVVEDAKSVSPDPGAQEAYIRSKGGTNPWGPWVLGAAAVALLAFALSMDSQSF